MIELQLLNTLLFSNDVRNLKKAINTLNDPTNPKQGELTAEQVKNILSYAVVHNPNLNEEVINKALTEDANKTAKDEEVIKKALTKAAKKALTEAVKEAKEADKKAKEEAVEKTAKNYLISNFTTSKLTEILDEVIKQSFKDQTALTKTAKKAFTESVEKAAKNYLISKFTTSELTKISDEIIQQSFKDQEAKHKFFSPKTVNSQDQQPVNSLSFEAAENQYVKAFKFNNLITTYIEKGTNNINHADYAYKMLICFGKDFESAENKTTNQTIINKFIKFLSANNFHEKESPVNSFMEEVILPEKSENIILQKWREMIQKNGTEALKFFAYAGFTELLKAQESAKDSHLPSTNIEKARSLYIKSQYPEYDKYPEAAELCYTHNRPNETFTEILRVEENKKTADNIPDIHVDGKDILQTNGKDCAGYHLVKLPIDVHTYFLGHIVNDCRSIDKAGRDGVEKGITDKNSGFYVLLKGHTADSAVFNEDGEINYQDCEIVGQSYAFRTKAGNLTFNSWENLCYAANSRDKVGDDHIAAQMLKKACEEIIRDNCDISRITIGTADGARTPEELKQNIVLFNELPLSLHHGHLNTKCQAVIAQNLKLEEIQNELKEKVPNIEIMSIKHGEKLKHLLEQPEFIAAVNEMLSNNNQLLQVILSSVEDLNPTSFQGFSDPKIINLLTSPDALKAYDAGVKIDQLKDLNTEKIYVLTSFKALEAYKLGITFKQLASFEIKKIEALVSHSAYTIYERGIAAFEQLASFKIGKIEALTSCIAHSIYKFGITFDQLAGLEAEQIKAMVSMKYPENLCTIEQVKQFLTDKIKDLTHHTSEEPESVLFGLQDTDSLKSSCEVDITGQHVVHAD
ncbi:MAG: hypothetical protein LN563_06250 [Rickettsia endosymbiont of Platyusa sonomae]|nr:hypothetical protein [Rickettsia endosymbiont of Platyusa sonomae]